MGICLVECARYEKIYEIFFFGKYKNFLGVFSFILTLVVLYGSETISSIGPKIWALLTPEMKNIKSPEEFKKNIQEWTPNDCPCRLCKIFIQNIGFL